MGSLCLQIDKKAELFFLSICGSMRRRIFHSLHNVKSKSFSLLVTIMTDPHNRSLCFDLRFLTHTKHACIVYHSTSIRLHWSLLATATGLESHTIIYSRGSCNSLQARLDRLDIIISYLSLWLPAVPKSSGNASSTSQNNLHPIHNLSNLSYKMRRDL